MIINLNSVLQGLSDIGNDAPGFANANNNNEDFEMSYNQNYQGNNNGGGNYDQGNYNGGNYNGGGGAGGGAGPRYGASPAFDRGMGQNGGYSNGNNGGGYNAGDRSMREGSATSAGSGGSGW